MGGLVVVALLVWALRPQPVPADFAAVERGTLQVTVDEEGETRVRDRFVVSAPLPGRMQRVELEPGDPVVAGKTLVATFLPADPVMLDARARAEIEARARAADSARGGALADRDRVRAELQYARSEWKRYQELAKEGIAARDRLEAAERQVRTLEEALKSADFAVRTAEHQLEVARASLMQTRSGARGGAIPLRSPIDGVVLRRLIESETVVTSGQPIVEIGNLAHLEIVSDLLSTDAVRVEPGQVVRIERWGGDAPLGGRVRRVEPSGFTKISALGVEEQRVNVIVDFESAPRASPAENGVRPHFPGSSPSKMGSDPIFPPRPPIGDGFRVEVRIIVWQKENVLKVPVSSLVRHDGKWAVYRVEEGKAVRRLVEIGQRNGLEAELLSGLTASDRVVVFPSDAITDGVAVVPRS